MSKLQTSVATLGLAGALVLGTACMTDDPTEQDYDDVARSVSVAISDGQGGGDVGSMSDSIALAGNSAPEGVTAMGDGSFQGERAGLTYSYSITCQDSPSGPATLCDASTTDVARVVVAWAGSLDLPQYDASASRNGDWTLSDIQSGTAAFNGDGTFSFDSEFVSLDGNRTRTYQLDYAARYNDVLIDVATEAPVGGNAVFNVSADRTASNQFRDVEVSFDIEVDVTFNGNGTATLVLDGSRSYDLELASGVIVRL